MKMALAILIFVASAAATNVSFACDCTAPFKGTCTGSAKLVGDSTIHVTAPPGQCAIVEYAANGQAATETITDKAKGVSDVDWLGDKNPKVEYTDCHICKK
ncbi:MULTISPECIES: hypothetical protein [unclassified Mesorhizobium]|uniref:hypothetical protein n=1 Tax=unclassified Mesorhizobium TaxID=325217 RepID=UPI00333B3292